ncbi:MAG: thioredoxin family protein [Candidatus Fermentibacteria bacterium]
MKKKIKVLGTGCPKCIELAELANRAAKQLGIEYELEKVSDINDIISYGVMLTPALVVDGEVKFSGSLPSFDQIIDYIR